MIPSSLRGEYVSTGSRPLISVAGGNYFVLIDLGYNYNVQQFCRVDGQIGIKRYDLHCVSEKYYIKYNTLFSLGLHVFNCFSPQSLWNYLIISFFYFPLFLFWSFFLSFYLFSFFLLCSPHSLSTSYISRSPTLFFFLSSFLSHNLIPNS